MNDTEDKIINAAVGIFSDKGYSGATTKEIAEHAGVNEVTLFRKFGSKKALLSAVIEKSTKMIFGRPEYEKELTWNLKEDLVNIGNAFYFMLSKNIKTVLMTITEAQRIPELKIIIARVPEIQNKMLASYLKEQIKRGVCGNINDPETAAQAFYAMIFEYCISGLVIKRKENDYKKAIENYTEFFINGIGS